MTAESVKQLYFGNKISADECFCRIEMINQKPRIDEAPAFVRLHLAQGGEKELLEKIRRSTLPKEPITEMMISVRLYKGRYIVSYKKDGRYLRYPGCFDSRAAAQNGVVYLVWHTNKEIERRNKKALGRAGNL